MTAGEEPTQGDTFFDSHLHAFDLTHPDYLAFVRRFTLRPLLVALASSVGWLAAALASALRLTPRLRERLMDWIDRRLLRIRNLLAVMQYDLGAQFLLLEDDLRKGDAPLLRQGKLQIAGHTYTSIVLTPLMMDFDPEDPDDLRLSHRVRAQRFRYSHPVERKIVKQVLDLERGIRRYRDSGTTTKLPKGLPRLAGTPRVFEIYPFLGLNPRNYATLDKQNDLLAKYFSGYTGRRADLREHMGRFDGDIDRLGDHAFAGVKLYPPLGFHPWPPERGKRGREERSKVRALYRFCEERGIPITVHGGSGGFAVLKRRKLKAYTAIANWEQVLTEFPALRICIAHFPVKEYLLWKIRNPFHPLQRRLMRLVIDHPNVYVDISCRATKPSYYRKLKRALRRLPQGDAEKLRRRVLFGTDFSIHLMWIDAYARFYRLFADTPHLSPEEKHRLCSTNPAEFLFRE